MGRGIYHYNLPPSPGGNVRVVGEKVTPWREGGKNGGKEKQEGKKVKRRERKRRGKEKQEGRRVKKGKQTKRQEAREMRRRMCEISRRGKRKKKDPRER